MFDWKNADPFGANTPTTNTISFNLRFPGQYFDNETSFHYNMNRYYNPKTGKYLQADPIGLEGGQNVYNYLNNNPLNSMDEFGLQSFFTTNPFNPQFSSNVYLYSLSRLNKFTDTVIGTKTLVPFGCILLGCVSTKTDLSATQLSIELSFGGGVELCDKYSFSPMIKESLDALSNKVQETIGVPERSCRRDCGMYDLQCQSQIQYPGISLPSKVGGLFIGPSIKRDGSICTRYGPQFSLPLPSIELGDIK